MNQPNLYRPPASDITDADRSTTVREIVVYWEKKRLLYNLVNLLIGVILLSLLLPAITVTKATIWIMILSYGVGANICYSIGAYLNVVMAVFRPTDTGVWKSLFYFGFVISILLTVLLGSAFGFRGI